MNSASVLLYYCYFHIIGNYDAVIPLDTNATGLVTSRGCISVSGLPWNEGETTITLGYSHELQLPAEPPRYDGMLDTSDGVVDLFDARNPEILCLKVTSRKTRIRIWTSDRINSDKVLIAVG